MTPRALAIQTEDVAAILAADLPWDQLSGCTVAVTGAGGFLGGTVVQALLGLNNSGRLAQPITVLALGRDGAKLRDRFGAQARLPTLKLLTADLCNPAGLELRADHIIHAASQASPKYYRVDPVGTLAPNVIGTWHLLQQAKVHGTQRFLFISSSEVYGRVAHEGQLAESSAWWTPPMCAAAMQKASAWARRCACRGRTSTVCMSASRGPSTPTVPGWRWTTGACLPTSWPTWSTGATS